MIRTAASCVDRSVFDSLKKKVLLDLFVSPWTLVPIIGGLSAWMVSWGLDGVTALNLAGLAGVVIGSGIQATRLIFGIEDLTADAQKYLEEQEEEEQNKRLDALQRRLLRDGDPRTQDCLKTLRLLHASFHKDAAADGSPITLALRGKVDELFHESVAQLERSFDLFHKARQLPRRAGGPLLEKRRQAVDEVVVTINHLSETIAHYHDSRLKKEAEGLARLRSELDETVEMARRAEARMDDLENERSYDIREFE